MKKIFGTQSPPFFIVAFSAAVMLLHGFSFAQSVAATAAAAAGDQPIEAEPAETEGRSRVLYVDFPIPIIEGQDPIYPDQGVPAQSPEDDPAFAERSLAIAEYSTAVATTETSGGVWDVSLVEQLAALGELHQAQGDHIAALQSLDRAMHVSRINSGLHTTDQIPIVEDMIESYTTLGQWSDADLYHDYLFYIQQRAYGPTDPRIIPVLEKMGRWNMQAFNIGLGEALGIRLSTAQLMFNAAARLVEFHFGKDDERYVPYLNNVVQTSYQISRNPQLLNQVDNTEFRTSQELLAQLLNERYSTEPAGFSAGEGALREIVTHYEQGEDVNLLAEALTNLADWYLIYEQRRRAGEVYQTAWNLLAEQEDGTATQEKLFGTVVPIPVIDRQPRRMGRGSAKGEGRASLRVDYADLMFTVTRNGSVRSVQVLSDENADNIIRIGNVSRTMRGLTFRPILVDGVPVTTEGNRFRVRYWY